MRTPVRALCLSHIMRTPAHALCLSLSFATKDSHQMAMTLQHQHVLYRVITAGVLSAFQPCHNMPRAQLSLSQQRPCDTSAWRRRLHYLMHRP